MTVASKAFLDLTGRTALVTGASGGIGQAIALALAGAGATLLVGGRSPTSLTALVAKITTGGGRASPWPIDLADTGAVDAAVGKLGHIDILVNCAGTIARGTLAETDDASWQHVLDVNLGAPFRLCRAVGPLMAQRGWGRIVNVGSALSVQGKARAVGYVSSKHGLAGLTRALAAELGPAGICVNALCPGYVRTEITEPLQNDPAYVAKIEAATPLGRWAVPADMAGPALFLCSEAAAYVDGLLLTVDGGLTSTH